MPEEDVLELARKLAALWTQHPSSHELKATPQEVLSAVRKANVQRPGEPLAATLARIMEGTLEDLKEQKPLVLGCDAGHRATRDGTRPVREKSRSP